MQFDESLIQRLKFICEFAKVTPTFINGSIRKIEKTNNMENNKVKYLIDMINDMNTFDKTEK